jgi:hypothetical protein
VTVTKPAILHKKGTCHVIVTIIIIIINNEKRICTLIDVAILGNKNVIKK